MGLLFVGTVLVLLFAGGAGGVALSSHRGAAPARPTAATTPTSAPVSAVVKPITDALVGLLQQRDQAYSQRDLALLARVYAPGSPSLARDRGAITALRRRHQRLSGFATTALLDATDPDSEHQWTVLVTLVTGRVEVVDTRTHQVVRVDQRISQDYRCVLVERGGRWLIWRLDPVRG